MKKLRFSILLAIWGCIWRFPLVRKVICWPKEFYKALLIYCRCWNLLLLNLLKGSVRFTYEFVMVTLLTALPIQLELWGISL